MQWRRRRRKKHIEEEYRNRIRMMEARLFDQTNFLFVLTNKELFFHEFSIRPSWAIDAGTD
jgi:hypothetical protein